MDDIKSEKMRIFLSIKTDSLDAPPSFTVLEEAIDDASTTTTEPPKIPCDGKRKICVEPNQCVKGFIDGNTLTRSYNYVSDRYSYFGVKDVDVVIPVLVSISTDILL